ncbi:MAG TPA: hypothetical protein VEG64_06985 [Candidatus Sulfotelmatobacter sp.]|nr:hypothetical protein [Candidatus Sulfotelmatobacter sp.]
MSHDLIVQFVGFEVSGGDRVYSFTVREPSAEPRDFKLTISNNAFNDHRISYQDAPDVCSLKLRRELAAYANHPPETRLDITDGDLEDYRSTHSPRKAASPFARKTAEDD